MPTADVNGVKLSYEVTGQGEAVVFVHGYTGSTEDWANQTKVLTPGYKVVTFDLRGHGKSQAPEREEGYSIPLFAEDVFALLGKLNIDKCCLVGHSLGGFIALEFAISHREMLAGLVLVDTSSGAFTRDPAYAELRKTLDEIACNDGMAAAFEYDAGHNPTRIERFQRHPGLKETALQKMVMTSVEGYCFAAKATAKWEPVTPHLPEIKVPTLIFWGDEDLAFAEPVQVLKQDIPNSELVMVQNVGHSPHEEAPDVFNEALLKFLGKLEW
jgi:pimeloyl-ACP methyl ester carboxylesterase